MSYAMICGLPKQIAVTMFLVGAVLTSSSGFAEPLSYADRFRQPRHFLEELAAIEPMSAGQFDPQATSASLRRRIVRYATDEVPGTIVIDTPETHLYLVLGDGKAIRYGIGVGRKGFIWSGVKTIVRKAEWPNWIPPDEMLQRQPYLPRFMAGGPGNPLGARAMYLNDSLYRIHGTNDVTSIGRRVSSGCIRMLNADVVDLYSRVDVGAKVVALPARPDRPSPSRTQGSLAKR
jgi:lipoprotein-anchoring transpeptidase ErfK/SrfK